MANVITTNYFREQLAAGNINLSGDSYAVALMNGYVSSASETTLKAISAWANVSAYEASAVGYSAASLTAPIISIITGNTVMWDGTDVVWSNITLSPYGFVIYRISDGLVVGFVAFTGGQIDAVNGSITIQWNAAGIANII